MTYQLRITFENRKDADIFQERALFAWSFQKTVEVRQHGRAVTILSESRDISLAMLVLAMPIESLKGAEFTDLSKKVLRTSGD
jgi:hypothetical protein